MQLSQRSFAAVVVAAAILVYATAFHAQQPEPLRLSSPPAHSLNLEPQTLAHVQTQTAQGELLDVDGKAQTLSVKTPALEMTFRYNEQTKVSGAQKGVAGLATMTGSKVTVMYKKDGQINLATNIEVKANPK